MKTIDQISEAAIELGDEFIENAFRRVFHKIKGPGFSDRQIVKRRFAAELQRAADRGAFVQAGANLVPSINAIFETVGHGVTGLTDAKVKRVERQDDGSLTVVIDSWPTPTTVIPTTQGRAYAIEGTQDGTQSSYGTVVKKGYESLFGILVEALNQAQAGKGAERHNLGGGLPFERQRMQQISELIGSVDGMSYQACKKITEGVKLPTLDRQVAELLGAINYIAGMITFLRKRATEKGDDCDCGLCDAPDPKTVTAKVTADATEAQRVLEREAAKLRLRLDEQRVIAMARQYLTPEGVAKLEDAFLNDVADA